MSPKTTERNSESSLYAHTLYFLFLYGPVKKDDFEEKLFQYLADNNLLFPIDKGIIYSRESRTRNERVYQQLRNLAKSNKSLAPSFFVKETATHFELNQDIFQAINLSLRHVPPAAQAPASMDNMDNTIFYGPPGSGKTFLAYQENPGCQKTVIQFHPSYSYENFVQGERLVSIGDTRFVQVVDGPLMMAYRKATDSFVTTKAKVCETTAKDVWLQLPVGILPRYDIGSDTLLISLASPPQEKSFLPVKQMQPARLLIDASLDVLRQGDIIEIYFKSGTWRNQEPQILIIDEINRADVAKVFGELLNAIATSTGGNTGNKVILQYSGERFEWPGNMRIIGTMNSSDRSIGEMDQALKRRFRFKAVKAEPSLLSSKNVVTTFSGVKENAKKMAGSDISPSLLEAIDCCEDSCDNIVRLYNQLGLKHNPVDFFFLPLPSESLQKLHEVILDQKEALFGVNRKLIGHSFHMHFAKEVAKELYKSILQGALSDVEATRELSNTIRKRYEVLITQEIGPQIESIVMGNESIEQMIFAQWKEANRLLVKSFGNIGEGHDESNASASS